MGIVDEHILIAPVNVRSDLAPILGRSTGDVGQLCGDMRWNSQLATPAWERAGGINPMAVYKSVCHSNPGMLSMTERANTRFGFGSSVPTLDLTENVPISLWSYQPPRGMNGGGTGVHEWYRVLDFVKSTSETQTGYDKKACAPLTVMVGQLTYNDESQILVYGNYPSNWIRTDGNHWEDDHSLSLSQLLGGYTGVPGDLSGCYISFLLIRNNSTAKNLVVTNMTLSSFVQAHYSYNTFLLYAQGNGNDYPSIPILNGLYLSSTYTVIACLVSGMQPTGTAKYAVYTPDNTPGFSSLLPYSLGFVSGCDRTTAPLTTGGYIITNMSITSVTVTSVDRDTEIEWNGLTWRAFAISVYAEFDTSSVPYQGTLNVSGSLLLTNASSYRFGATPSSGDSALNDGVAASLTIPQSGQNKLVFTADQNEYIWVPYINGQLEHTTVTATVTITYPVENPVTQTGSGSSRPPSNS